MQKSLGGMAAQVTELDRLSLETRSGAGELVEKLTLRTHALGEIARDLSTKQQTIDLALQHRQTSLEGLLGQLEERGRALHDELGGFTKDIETSFSAAQSRAEEIGASLASMTKSAASSVTGQFESIRDNAARERERTQAALQQAYDQANRQIGELLEGGNAKFQGALEEMRKMAAEIQRELDSARVDIKRGVLDLPKETTDAANAMRRVVSDQIRALKELAAIVNDSDEAFDLVETAPSRPEPVRAEPAPRREPPPALRASVSDDYGVTTAIATALAPAPEAPRPRPQPLPQPVPQAPTLAASAPLAPSSAERAQGGWLSNLLAAASRDEPRETPRLSGDSLEAISADIGRLVDAESAGELWERWRAGETGAISRRLYTVAGQQTFDDIRRRYRAEGPFRDSVNRYIQEFERLLAKIGQNDRDGAQARLAMLSDSGKVYIMLAHAAGRLG
jgi:hypothetical protein